MLIFNYQDDLATVLEVQMDERVFEVLLHRSNAREEFFSFCFFLIFECFFYGCPPYPLQISLLIPSWYILSFLWIIPNV